MYTPMRSARAWPRAPGAEGRIAHGLAPRRERELAEAVQPSSRSGIHERQGIEVVDLRSDLRPERGWVEAVDGPDGGPAGLEPGPERIPPDADGCHHADTRDPDAPLRNAHAGSVASDRTSAGSWSHRFGEVAKAAQRPCRDGSGEPAVDETRQDGIADEGQWAPEVVLDADLRAGRRGGDAPGDAHTARDAPDVAEVQAQRARVAVIRPQLRSPGHRQRQRPEPSHCHHPGHEMPIAASPLHDDAPVVGQHVRPARHIPGEGEDALRWRAHRRCRCWSASAHPGRHGRSKPPRKRGSRTRDAGSSSTRTRPNVPRMASRVAMRRNA